MLDETPLFIDGNEIGCALIHGFTGRPYDLRPLADRLIAEGYSVALPALPGHTGDNSALATYHGRDWQRAVHDTVTDLRRRCKTIILVGFSMGGALCLLENRAYPVDALVLLAPALGLARRRIDQFQLPLLGGLKHVRPWFYPFATADFSDARVRAQLLARSPEGTNLDDPTVQAHIRQQVRLSTHAIHQFYRVARQADRLARATTTPTLIMHGRFDQTIPARFSVQLFKRLRSRDKHLQWWDSDHLLVTGPQGPAVVEQCMDWIKAQVAMQQPAAALQSAL